MLPAALIACGVVLLGVALAFYRAFGAALGAPLEKDRDWNSPEK